MNVGDTEQLPTVLSFCTGYGGVERGLDLAGVQHRVLAYVEIEAFAIANLVSKMEQGKLAPAPIWTDLKTFPAGLFRDAVDIITGGYPCQPFSHAGKRQGSEDPRHLWPYISEAVGIIRPGRVFFENVEGHISLGLNEVVSDLEDRGYDTTWGIFSAAEVGAPHRRKRVYILAHSISAGLSERELHPGGVYREGPALSGENAALASSQERDVAKITGRWCPEPDVGRASNGCAAWLDGFTDRYGDLIDGLTHKGWTRKTLQKLRRETLSQAIQRATGRLFSVSPAATLLAILWELAENEDCGWLAVDSEAEEGFFLRTLWQRVELARASLQSRCDGQQPREFADLMRELPCPPPSQFPTAWAGRFWEDGVPRVVDGCPNRVDRIRLLGNGVVPQTACRAWQVLDALPKKASRYIAL